MVGNLLGAAWNEIHQPRNRVTIGGWGGPAGPPQNHVSPRRLTAVLLVTQTGEQPRSLAVANQLEKFRPHPTAERVETARNHATEKDQARVSLRTGM